MNMPEALKQQKNEINDFTIYTLLSKKEKNEKNRKIFVKIANEEKTHYEFWKQITKQDLKPSALIVYWYTFLVSIFGTSFSLKLLESREDDAIELYHRLSFEYPQAKVIYHEEKHHEIALIDMLEDKKLVYAGAIVLGMNDALVELTGTLSGIALAFDKALVVGVTGMIMGIAASLSMAGSAYLEAKENEDTAISSSVYALYTGGSYILTTLLLVLPFFIFSSMYTGLFMMFVAAFLTIISFNFYVSVAKNQSFLKRSSQMLAITFGVALISFMTGYVVKHYFGIEI
jgi:VIT1/CCC1 family predicted Fe2+/Mn2+ transporter